MSIASIDDGMNRRSVVAWIATGLVAAIAGCASDEPETITQTSTEAEAFDIDLEASQTVELSVRVVEGELAVAELVAPDGEEVASIETQDERSTEVTAAQEGTHEAWIHPDGEATIRVEPV